MTDPVESASHILLVCTVGGTPEPLVKSLLHWKPQRVVFIPSERTRSLVDAVLRGYAEDAGKPLAPGCYRLSPMSDPEDLSSCLQHMREMDREIWEWLNRGGNYAIITDFTGGTKCMSAALALQARRWPCRFSYVGGERRTKGDVGTVETGSERVVHSANPWDALGYQAMEECVAVFNRGGYAAAAELLSDTVKRAENPTVKRTLSTLKAVTDAYAAWDRFDHRAAGSKFGDALKNCNDLAAIFSNASKLIHRLERHKARVEQLAGLNRPDIAWIEDLVSNARRRACESRFDDAVARLYRAVEALAQVRLREHFQIETKSVPVDCLPKTLRCEWEGAAREGALSLGLQDAWCLLQELGDDVGKRFAKTALAGENSPLSARNLSILAHGFAPIGEEVYNRLNEELTQLLNRSAVEANEWKLPDVTLKP